MKKIILWCALILALLVTFIWPTLEIPSADARLTSIPKAGPDFQTRELELSPEDKVFLGEAHAMKFLVTMQDRSQMVLTIVDGTKNRHAVHDPSYCFSGAGWKNTKIDVLKLNSGEANLVTLTKENNQTKALWFFDDGKQQFTSPLEYWFITSARRATLGKSGDEPVLVTLRGLTGEPVNWDRVRQVLLPSLGFH